MKKLLLLAAMIPALVCCTQPTEVKVKINAKNYDAEKMNLAWFTPEGEMKMEPLAIENGKAEAIIEAPEGTNLMLVSLDSRSSIELERGMIPGPQVSFFAEKGTTTISFDAEKWPELTIKGGKLNKDMNTYWADMGPLEARSFAATRRRVQQRAEDSETGPDPEAEKIQQEMKAVREKFVNANPGSMLSLDLLAGMFREFSPDDFEARFNKLDQTVRESEKAAALAQRIAMAKSVLPGNPAPQFTKMDQHGNEVSLSDYRGKYLLMDFWGTWCGPCRSSHPHLVQLYEKYNPLGLEFINIAQEGGKDPRGGWLKGIEEDGLVWTQILNDEGRQECDVVSLYSIQAFPTKVLIDPQGKLVATWVGDSPEVDEKLKEIFGQ